VHGHPAQPAQPSTASLALAAWADRQGTAQLSQGSGWRRQPGAAQSKIAAWLPAEAEPGQARVKQEGRGVKVVTERERGGGVH